MSLKTTIALLPGLLLLTILTHQPAIAAQQAISERDVTLLLERMDRYANDREFSKLKSLISKDAAFAIINEDIDEANTVVIDYNDYFEGIDEVLATVDQYRIRREIVKITFNQDRSLARVLTETRESFVSDGVEDFDRSAGFLDISYVDDKLVIIGGMASIKSRNKYSLTSCPDNCPELRAVFPNIASIQSDWLDGRYQGLVIDNPDERKKLEQDRMLVKALTGNGEIYALVMTPFETEREFYRIDNRRTMYKLLEDNVSDFISVHYVDPEEHESITDYTRYRNSLWLNDQISNLILVIPEQALIVDWSDWDEIGIYSTNDEQFEFARHRLRQIQIAHTVYEQDWPTFDMYRLYMSDSNIEKSRKNRQALELANETVSSEFGEMSAASDNIPILVFDDSTNRRLIDQALEMDIMLIRFDDFNTLLEKLVKDML